MLNNINIIEDDWKKNIRSENRMNLCNSISLMLGTKN